MGIDVSWDQETVIHWQFGETWDISDFFDASAKSCHMIDAHKGHIDLMLSFMGYRMPPNFITHLGKLHTHFPENTWIVMIETNRLIRSIVNITSRVFGNNSIYIAPNVVGAREMILDHQEDLKDRTRPLKA